MTAPTSTITQRRHARRAATLAVAATLLVVACGSTGGDDGSTATVDGAGSPATVRADDRAGSPATTSEQAPPSDDVEGEWLSVDQLSNDAFDPGVLAVADQATATFGSPEAAAVALLTASARGYDATQVLTAAGDGTLSADGTISIDGEVVAPAGPPSAAVVLPSSFEPAAPTDQPHGFRQAIAAPAPAEPDAVFETLEGLVDGAPDEQREAGGWALVLIIGLLRAGYSAEQIVELFVFGDQGVGIASGRQCASITSPDGTGPTVFSLGDQRVPTVVPANAPLDDCDQALDTSVGAAAIGEAQLVVSFEGRVDDGASTYASSWSVDLDDGYGEARGVIEFEGPCTAGEDGPPVMDTEGTFDFTVEVAEADDGGLIVVASGFQLGEYREVNLTDDPETSCREVFDIAAASFEELLGVEETIPGDIGTYDVTLGVFDGTITVRDV